MSKSKQDGSKMTEEDFERQMSVVFATCWNRLDFTHLIAYLAVDVVYESQNVFQALTGRKEVFDYLCEKAETIRKSESDTQVSAELATLDQKHGLRPCVLLSQGSRDDKVALVLIKTARNRIVRIDLCTVAPSPSDAIRSGVYPVLQER